jgi:polysaccharide deacetylase family protein (PEP-CTERM system associated)
MQHSLIKNALTFDVEDYFQVSAFAKVIRQEDWLLYDKGRVVKNTQKILELLDNKNIQATFFVLGWIADRYSSLVSEIYKAGHEVASHGWSHQLVYNQNIETFRSETDRSKKLLEDITGAQVLGYRAASYSITPKSYWAFDVLVELGFQYDSSVFPVYHDRYGMPDAPRFPYTITSDKKRKLVEFPLSTYEILNYRLPIAGGGYFRLFPYWLTRFCLSAINQRENPFVFYLHPWEIDTDQPLVKASISSRFRHYNNLNKCYSRLERLMDEFPFTSMKNVLGEKGLNLLHQGL